MKNLLLLVVSSLLFNSILFSQDEVTSKSKNFSGNEQFSESPFIDLNNSSRVIQKLFPSDDKYFFEKNGVVDDSDMIRFGGAEIVNKYPSNPADLLTANLVTAEFTIPESNSDGKVLLELNEEYELEAENDFSKIYIRINEGEEWILLDTRSGVKKWGKTYIDLSHYKGNSVQLKFELKTGGSFESSSWAIRDINIVSVNQKYENTRLASQIENESDLSQDENYKIAQSDLDISDSNKDPGESLTEQFTEQTSISLPGVYNSSVAWGDYDNDGDLDILLTGHNSSYNPVSKIYKNNGDGTFTEQTSISLTGVSSGSVAWGDYDNDGYLDILLSGDSPSYTRVSKIYKNNGNGTFTEQTSISLTGAYGSSVAWGDYDNDGDLDILLTGENSSFAPVSKIYKNNGDGTFTEQTSISLTGVNNSSVAWGDYDNDGDLDILLTGYSTSTVVSKIFKNNGDGTFTDQTSISLKGVENSSVAWGDYDNDGYLDILLTGQYFGSYISKIYKNNGNGAFTEQTSISLTGVAWSSVAWGDYDNDGDLDILLTGFSSSLVPTSKIYKNNGDGTFTDETSISLKGVIQGSVAWGDYDNDGDFDILLTGAYGASQVSKIYKNNNVILNTVPNAPTNLTSTVIGDTVAFNWNKSTDNETPQNGLHYNLVIGTTANSVNTLSPMADRTTGFRRVVRLGNSQTNSWTIKNLPAGTYYWSVQAIDGAYAGSQFASVQTVTITGSISLIKPNGGEKFLVGQIDTIKWTSSNVQNVKLEYSTDGGGNWTTIIDSISSANLNYLWEIPNTSSAQCKVRISDVSNPSIADTSKNLFSITQQFAEQTSISLTGVGNSSVAWGDYDNDGDLDILLTGANSSNVQVSKIYKNNGDETFTEQTSISLTGFSEGSVAWGDYDSDGDLDILLTGSTGNGYFSKIYKNNGDGTFTEQTSISLPGVNNSSVAWGDYDNDGDLDILLTGNTGNSNYVSKIYKNNGDGTFTEQTSISLTGVLGSSVAWGDYDNDGDLDFLLTGYSNVQVSKIYKNNGNGTFTEQISISLTGVHNGSVAWGDYDNDGDLDILLTGYTTNGGVSKIYKNNGDGLFTEQTSIILTGVTNGSVAWGDYDNDGDLDILLTGYISWPDKVSKIYKNNGDGTFTEQAFITLTGISQGSGVWGDYDNDGDLDILLTGYNSSFVPFSKIYKNNNSILNSVPNAPTNLTSTVNGGTVTFNWNKSTDNKTPQNGLHYNVVIGTTANSVNTLSPMADRTTGFRRVVRLGNSQRNSWTIKNLPVGTYYWSVQTIDGAYAGSQFGQVDSFSIQTPTIPILVAPGNNNSGLINPIIAKWNQSLRVEKYKLQVSTDNLFSSLIVNDSTLSDTTKLLPNLANYSQYYWRVKAVNVGGESDWSTVWNFKTLGNPYASNLITPLDASINQPLDGLTFKWTKAKERIETIQKYQFQISTDSLFTTTFVNDSTLTDTTKVVGGMGFLTKYFWRVRAQNQTGWGDWSNTWRFTTIIEKPSIPVLALPTNGSKGLLNPITAKWNKSLRVEKYKLQVSTDNLFSSLIVNDSTLTDTTKLLPNLANYSQYYWRVKAVNVGGESEWSTVWNFKTLGNPYASNLLTPLDASINQPLNGLTFKWTKAKERIETIQKYQFQISTDSLFGTLFVNDSTLVDTARIVNGMGYLTKYFWRVRAQNQTGWGDWSNTWRFTTIIDKPTVPVLALPVNGDKGILNPITTKWNKSLRVEKYKLQVSTDGLFGSLIVNDSTLSDTTKLLPNLANYSQYYWRVKAVNVGGESDWSTVWNFKTLGNPYASNLVEPLDNSLNHPLNGLTFKWTKAKERIETIQKYQLQISTDSLFASTFVNDSTLTDTSKVVGGMGYLTKYFWRVRAQNQTGWGDWSNTWRFTTIIEKPTVPVLALPVNGDKGLLNPITAKWNNSLRVEKYKLQVSTDSLFGSFVVNDSTLTDTTKLLPNLANYSQYYWRVKADNVGGESDWSTVWNFKTLGNPYASNLITPLDASVNQPVAGLTFNWTKAQERIETIQKYQLQISTDSLFASTFVNDSTLTDTTKVVGGMGYLTKYFWRVRAQNQTGWGDWSSTWRFTTIIEKPSVPLLASPVNNATQQLQPVVLKWRQSSRVEKYTLEVSESSNFTTLFLVDSTMTDTMRTLPQLQTPKTYYWRVKARNIGGNSEYSTVWNFRTLGFPIAVNLVAPENGSVNLPINDVLLKWSTAGEQTLGSVTSGGKGVNKAKGDMEPSSDNEGRNTPKKGNLFATGSANPTSGIESIGKYWLEIKTDTTNSALFYSDSTLTDTTKLMSGFGYLTTYYWRVKANNEVGWGSFSGWFKFTTIIERPTQPVLASPANNSLGSIQPVMVKWNSSQRAEKYTLEVSTNALFTTVVFKDTMIVDTLKTLPPLSPLTTYYWRVSGINTGGVSDTSSVWNFKTLGTPTVVTLVTPENNTVNVPISNVVFNWTKAIDRLETIQRYRFELKTDTTSSTFVVIDTLLTDTTKIVGLLSNLTDYYWRISAKNEAGWGEFTPWDRFTTIIAAPTQAVLSLPANNAVDIPIKPVFKWNSIVGAEKYHLQVASDLNFTNIVLLDSMLTDTAKTLTTDSLNYKTKYYWRVKAQNIGGTGIYSVVWNFTTKKKPIATPTALTVTATAVKRVTLSWADNSDNELGFIILRKTGDSTSTSTLVRIDSVGVDVTEFIDSTVTDTSYYSYRVMAYNADTLSTPSNYATIFTLTGIKDFLSDIPKEFTLYQNYPNPFNPSTIIRFALPKDAHVEIELYSIHGELMKKLVSEDKQAGYYEISLEIPSYASGIYLYRIVASPGDKSEPFVQTRKFILMK